MSCCIGLLPPDRSVILGAIIAGGRSSRFGSDKALAQIDGRALIDHVQGVLAPQVRDVIVVGRSHGGLRGISDQPAPGMGPLGGIAAALLEARAMGLAAVLTAPCDAYDLPTDLIRLLFPFPAYTQSLPVIGLWPTSAADAALALLESSEKHAITRFADRIGSRPVKLPREPVNINTPTDLERVERHGI